MTARRRDAKGGIRKSGRRWQARITVDGKRYSLGTFDTRNEAKAVLAATIAAHLRGEWTPPGSEAKPGTLDAHADQWFEHPTGRVKPGSHTLAEYRRLYDRRVAPVFGHMPLDEITPAMLQRWTNSMRSEGLSLSTLKNATGVLRRILADAHRLEVIDRNPLDRVEVRSSAPRREPMVCLSSAQVDALCDALGERLVEFNERRVGVPGKRPADPRFDPVLIVRTIVFAGRSGSGRPWR